MVLYHCCRSSAVCRCVMLSSSLFPSSGLLLRARYRQWILRVRNYMQQYAFTHQLSGSGLQGWASVGIWCPKGGVIIEFRRLLENIMCRPDAKEAPADCGRMSRRITFRSPSFIGKYIYSYRLPMTPQAQSKIKFSWHLVDGCEITHLFNGSTVDYDRFWERTGNQTQYNIS